MLSERNLLARELVLKTGGKRIPCLALSRVWSLGTGPAEQYTAMALDGTRRLFDSVVRNDFEIPPRRMVVSLDDVFASVISAALSMTVRPAGVAAVSARTKMYAYQLRPLLKYLGTPGKRVLIADEAGLGKTVEALYILVEEINRGKVSRAVILCPSHLRSKWRWEVRSKFGLEFSYGRLADIVRLLTNPKEVGFYIASLDCANSSRKQLLLQKAMCSGNQIDFLIIDEVHHCIGRGGDTYRRELALSLSSSSRAVVALSATPVQLEVLDLRRVHDVLFSSQMSDEAFLEMIELVAPLNTVYSCLCAADWSTEIENRFMDALNKLTHLRSCTPEIRDLARSLMSMAKDTPVSEKLAFRDCAWKANPLSSFLVRTRRKEVGQERKRRVCDIGVPLSSKKSRPVFRENDQVSISERGLFQEADRLIRKCFFHVHLRQLSSSLFGVQGLFQAGTKGFAVWDEGPKWLVPPEYNPETDNRESTSEEPHLSDEDRRACRTITGLFGLVERDTKWETLVENLNSLRSENPERKVVVFTQWIPTAKYFVKMQHDPRLSEMMTRALAGSTEGWEQRTRAVRDFRGAKGFAVLFTSDILSEGMDLYEADTVVNYDLPYNPQKLEQRIGRVDRILQKQDEIKVFNLYVKESVDEEILKYLETRMGYFKQSVGDMSAILESDSEEWDSIDETETAGILKRQQTLAAIEEQGYLRVIDDLLDEQAHVIMDSRKHDIAQMRWLPLVRTLSVFCSENRSTGVNDSQGITISGFDENALGYLITAVGGQDNMSLKSSLDEYRDASGKLRISLNPMTDAWFPSMHSPLMKYALRFCRNLVQKSDEEVLCIRCNKEAAFLLGRLELAAIGFTFEAEAICETEWHWWSLDSLSKWTLESQLSTDKIYGALKTIESDTESGVAESFRLLPSVVESTFRSWVAEQDERNRSLRLAQLRFEVQRLRGRAAHLDNRASIEEDAVLRTQLKDEKTILQRRIEEIEKTCHDYERGLSSPPSSAFCRVLLRVVLSGNNEQSNRQAENVA